MLKKVFVVFLLGCLNTQLSCELLQYNKKAIYPAPLIIPVLPPDKTEEEEVA